MTGSKFCECGRPASIVRSSHRNICERCAAIESTYCWDYHRKNPKRRKDPGGLSEYRVTTAGQMCLG